MSGSPWIRPKLAPLRRVDAPPLDMTWADPWYYQVARPVYVSPAGIVNGLAATPNAGSDFGPDTQGTTTLGLQEAINFAVSNIGSSHGCRIILLPGTFNLTGNIALPTVRFKIQGSGQAVTTVNFTGGTQGFIVSSSDQADKEFEDMFWQTDGTASAFITDNATVFAGQILFMRRVQVNNTSSTFVPLSTGTIANVAFTECQVFNYINLIIGKSGSSGLTAMFYNCYFNEYQQVTFNGSVRQVTFHGGEIDSTLVLANGITINDLSYIGLQMNPTYASGEVPIYCPSGSAIIDILRLSSVNTVGGTAGGNLVQGSVTIDYLFLDGFLATGGYNVVLPSPTRYVSFQSLHTSDLTPQTTNSTSYVTPATAATLSMTAHVTGLLHVRATVRVSNGTSNDSVTAALYQATTLIDSDSYVQDSAGNDRTFEFEYFPTITWNTSATFTIQFKVSAGTGSIVIVNFQLEEYGC